jgi:hypothetical protein
MNPLPTPPPFSSANRTRSSAVLLGGGIAVAVLLAVLALFFIKGCRRAERRVEKGNTRTASSSPIPREASDSTSSDSTVDKVKPAAEHFLKESTNSTARDATAPQESGGRSTSAPHQTTGKQQGNSVVQTPSSDEFHRGQDTSGSSADGVTTGSKSRTSKASPDQSVETAQKLLTLAREAAVSGDAGQAFVHARDAWLAVKDHENDAACRELAEETLAQMNQFAQQANAKYEGGDVGTIFGKPLLEE